jgi:apolipoprotein N-acyltransferase
MKCILPLLTGFLLVASFPRIDQNYLAWIAFIPLTVFVANTHAVGSAFWGGFIAGYVQFFALLTWIPAVLTRYGGLSAGLAWLAYALLVFVLACYPAAACGLTKYLIRKCGASFIFVFPAAWVVFEYAQSLSPFGGLPWLLAGYSQSRFLTMIQMADITGIYGVSFLLVWTASMLSWNFRLNARRLSVWMASLTTVLMIAGCVYYGRTSLRKWETAAPGVRVAMLQGNISFDEPDDAVHYKFQQGYVRMAERLRPSGADLLILPESPSPFHFESDAQYRSTIEQLARRFPLGIVFNNIRREENQVAARYFNSAYFVDGKGVLRGVYDKVHLVPFGEYIPLKRLFSFVETISRDVGSFQPGREHKVVQAGDHPAGAIICFEAVFPPLVRQFVLNGSQVIINLTNDGWYGDSAAPYQHLAVARLRAVENRRYLLRATNSGISAVVEPSGRIQASTGIMREAICEGRFEFIGETTFYTRYGDVFVLLCAIILAGSVIVAVLDNEGMRKRLAEEE